MTHLSPSHPPKNRRPLAAAGAAALVLAGAVAAGGGTMPDLDIDALAHGLAASIGPAAIVALLALSVVASPIPGGPVAMAAGALYGPWLGGGLTVTGAFAGAMIAFHLSRRLGQRALCASSNRLAVWITRPRPQTTLMALIFVSRLVPPVSFDAVSYLAGLTRIDAWRFAVATLAGVIPVSFAFAAMGAGLPDGGTRPLALAACGVTLLLPALVAAYRTLRRRRAS